MNNAKLIQQAIEHLLSIDETTTDTVEIQTGKYDDGSTMLTINVAFLAPEDSTTERK